MGSHPFNRNVLAASALMCGLLLWQPLAADPGPAQSTLEAVREDLRISRLTFERVKRQLYELLEPENFDPAVLADYAVYMDKVGSIMERHRQIVREMEELTGATGPASSATGWPTIDDEAFDPGLPVVEGALARLDRELDESLAEFDQFLLDEQYEALRRMRELDEASSEEMTDLAREAAAAVERLRDRGIDVDTSNPPEGGQQQGQRSPGGGASGEGTAGGGAGGQQQGSGGQGAEGSAAGGAPGEPGAPGSGTAGPEGEEGDGGAAGGEGGEGGDAGEGDSGSGSGEGAGEGGAGGSGDGSGSGSGAGGSGDPNAPPPGGEGTGGGADRETEERTGDRPPADDDDIVARQLREAAEKETDPELKEKLWEEYDRYKGAS